MVTHLKEKLSPLWALTVLLSAPLHAGVFGDGDALNGIEDDRHGISEGHETASGSDWFRSGGTVFCDGAIRGSATILAPPSNGERIEGVVIATAAHVFFDLETGQRWDQCEFRYLGLGALPGYRAELASTHTLLGAFDPAADPSEPSNGGGDWAFAWLGQDWRAPEGAIGLSPMPVREFTGAKLGLLAWNAETKQMSVSLWCQAVFSDDQDLGGGAWSGQLLDDCDSSQGASGGGLIVSGKGGDHLVAIRGGSHWDRNAWPPGAYPEGPPNGELWDPARFTNYARLLDEEVLSILQAWLRNLDRAVGP